MAGFSGPKNIKNCSIFAVITRKLVLFWGK